MFYWFLFANDYFLLNDYFFFAVEQCRSWEGRRKPCSCLRSLSSLRETPEQRVWRSHAAVSGVWAHWETHLRERKCILFFSILKYSFCYLSHNLNVCAVWVLLRLLLWHHFFLLSDMHELAFDWSDPCVPLVLLLQKHEEVCCFFNEKRWKEQHDWKVMNKNLYRFKPAVLG